MATDYCISTIFNFLFAAIVQTCRWTQGHEFKAINSRFPTGGTFAVPITLFFSCSDRTKLGIF